MGKKRKHDHSASREEKENDSVETLKEMVTNIDRRYKKRYRSRSPHRRDRSRTRHRRDGANAGEDQIVAAGLEIAHDTLSVDHDVRKAVHVTLVAQSVVAQVTLVTQSVVAQITLVTQSIVARVTLVAQGVVARENLTMVHNNLRRSREEADPLAPETTGPVSTEQQASVTAKNDQPEHEAELQEDVLNVIGPRLESDQKKAPSLHKDIVIRWTEIFKKGLSKEENKSLVEKYNIPENCGFIVAPVLNSEVVAARHFSNGVISFDPHQVGSQKKKFRSSNFL